MGFSEGASVEMTKVIFIRTSEAARRSSTFITRTIRNNTNKYQKRTIKVANQSKLFNDGDVEIQILKALKP